MKVAQAPTKPYKTVMFQSFKPLPDVENYDITVDNVHEFYANGIVVKNCMGKFHPHGNAAIEDAMANMIEGAYCPLLIGQGNFGSYTKEAPPAAARYCFRGDSLIATDEGFKRIEDMNKGKNNEKVSIGDKVLTHKGYSEASTWLYSGVRKLYMLHTTYGVVIATGNEPFVVMTEEGEYEWKTLDELNVGDIVLRRFSKYKFGKSHRPINFTQILSANVKKIDVKVDHFDEKVAEWLGFVLAGGTHSKFEIMVGMTNKELMDRYTELCKYIFGESVRLRFNTKYPTNDGWQRKTMYYVTLKGSGYSQFLEYLGQPRGHSYNRRIPDYVLSSSKREVVAFLRALLEGDGSSFNTMVYSTRSFELAEGLQTLLLAFGIRSGMGKSVLTHTRRIDGSSKLREVHNKPKEIKVRVCASDATKFWTEIGFLNKSKNSKYHSNDIIDGHLNGGVTRHIAAKYITNWLANYKNSLIYGKNNLAVYTEDKTATVSSVVSPLRIFKSANRSRQHITNMPVFENWFSLYKGILKEKWPSAYRYLTTSLQNFFLDTVENIIQVQPDHTYDLSVPETHSYTANGYVVHNTECKLNKLAEECLLDPYYLKVIPMLPNYDGKEKEPIYLPAKLPLILATGGSGVAVGTTTNLPSYTVESLKSAVMFMLEGKQNIDNKKKIASLLEFATIYGGEVADEKKERYEVFTSAGPVALAWINDYKIVDDNKMVITGFHPEWGFDAKWRRIREMEEVASAVDLSSKSGIQLEITLKKNADEDKAFTRLEDLNVGTITYRSNIIIRSVDNTKEVPEAKARFASMSPYDILVHWLKWRLKLEKLALSQEFKELKSKKAHEELLLLACNSLDIIFKLLKTKGINKIDELAKRLKITVEESKTIWSIAVGRLDSLSAKEQVERIRSISKRMKEVKNDFNNPRSAVLKSLRSSNFS